MNLLKKDRFTRNKVSLVQQKVNVQGGIFIENGMEYALVMTIVAGIYVELLIPQLIACSGQIVDGNGIVRETLG